MTTPAPVPVSETLRTLQTLLLAHLDENAPRDVTDTVIDYDGNLARHLCIVLIGMWGDALLASHSGDRRAALKQVYGMCGTAAAPLGDVPIAPRKKPAPGTTSATAPKPGQKPARKKAPAAKTTTRKR